MSDGMPFDSGVFGVKPKATWKERYGGRPVTVRQVWLKDGQVYVRYGSSHIQGTRTDTIEDFRTRFVEAGGEHRG